jgi:hypothetical protein
MGSTSRVQAHNKQDIEKLRKDIRNFMKLRKEQALNSAPPHGFRLFVIRMSPFIFLLVLAITIWYAIKYDFFSLGAVFFYILSFTFLAATLLGRQQLSVAPAGDEDEIDQWIWEKNMKSSIYGFSLLIGLTLIYSLIYENPVTKFVIILNFVVLAIVALC